MNAIKNILRRAKVEIALFPAGETLSGEIAADWIDDAAVDYFHEAGNTAEVWVGGIRPLDEVASSVDELAKLILASLEAFTD